MRQEFHLSILQKLSPQSHAYIGGLHRTVGVPSTRTLGLLKEAARGYIKSRREFKSWGEDVHGIDFVVYKVSRRNFPQLSSKPSTVISCGTPSAPNGSPSWSW